jgi:hypothetical protein
MAFQDVTRKFYDLDVQYVNARINARTPDDREELSRLRVAFKRFCVDWRDAIVNDSESFAAEERETWQAFCDEVLMPRVRQLEIECEERQREDRGPNNAEPGQHQGT